MVGFFNIFGACAGQLGTGSNIKFASLTLRLNGNPSSGTQSVHRVLKVWDEGTIVNDTFFSGTNSRGDTAPLAGTDFDNSLVTSFVPGDASTSLIQDWSDGIDDCGLIIFNSNADGWAVHSDNASTQSLRPLLSVTVAEAPCPGYFGHFDCGIVSHWCAPHTPELRALRTGAQSKHACVVNQRQLSTRTCRSIYASVASARGVF